MDVMEESNIRKYLIIARVGDSSLHSTWLEPKEFRSFDLCLRYYGEQPRRYITDCDYYSEGKGEKWPTIKKIVEGFGKDLEKYEAIWIPDEHISANSFIISRMFHIFTDQELLLAQPALTADSYSSSPVLYQHPEFVLRYIRFAGMTAPVFSPGALAASVTAMDATQFESEAEFYWPEDLPYPNRKTAVIDETPVKQPMPEGYQAIHSAKEESMPASGQEIDDEPHVTENAETSNQEGIAEMPAGEPETPPPPIRKAGRIGRSQRNRRSRKKTRLKQPFMKKRNLKNKKKKTKQIRKLKQSMRIQKPFIKAKRKYPAVKKKRLAA